MDSIQGYPYSYTVTGMLPPYQYCVRLFRHLVALLRSLIRALCLFRPTVSLCIVSCGLCLSMSDFSSAVTVSCRCHVLSSVYCVCHGLSQGRHFIFILEVAFLFRSTVDFHGSVVDQLWNCHRSVADPCSIYCRTVAGLLSICHRLSYPATDCRRL